MKTYKFYGKNVSGSDDDIRVTNRDIWHCVNCFNIFVNSFSGFRNLRRSAEAFCRVVRKCSVFRVKTHDALFLRVVTRPRGTLRIR